MAWRIHDFDPATGCGHVRSPHYGPMPFGRDENVQRVEDFERDEEVIVTVEGKAPRLVVTKLRPRFQRQPAGTRIPELEAAIGLWPDWQVLEDSNGVVEYWVGFCCIQCTPDPRRVRFEGVSAKSIENEEPDIFIEDCLVRLATTEESAELRVSVPDGSTVWCLVTQHGTGCSEVRHFVVSRDLVVVDATAGVTLWRVGAM